MAKLVKRIELVAGGLKMPELYGRPWTLKNHCALGGVLSGAPIVKPN